MSFSGRSVDDDDSIQLQLSNPNDISAIGQNKDDKLTQSQLMRRMLEAEERDNQRDHKWEAGAQERDMIDKDRLNDARFGMVDSPKSRGRGKATHT